MNITHIARGPGRWLAVLFIWLGAGACLAAPGDIDVGFGNGGSIPSGGAVLTMPDGGLVVGRRITGGFEIVAYDPSGKRLDLAFGTAGRTFISIPANAYFGGPAARAADGKLLFSGERSAGGGTFVRTILRLATNGSPDPTFGSRSDGSVDLPDFKQIVGLAGLQNGRTLVLEWRGGCDIDSCAGPLAVWRLLANGNVDSTFGDNGAAVIPESSSSGEWPSIFSVRPDGSIVVGDNSSAPTLAVLTPAGAIDTTFDAAVAKSSEGWWHRGVMLPDGGLLLAGTAGVLNQLETWDTRLLKLRPDGRVDTSFGNGTGMVTLNLSAAVSTRTDLLEQTPEIALSPVGSQVYLQTTIGPNSTDGDLHCLAVARLNASGALDATFGQRGVTCVTKTDAYMLFVDRLAMQASGEPLLVLGSALVPAPFQPAVYRLRLDSTPSPGVINTRSVVGIDEGVGTLAIKVTRTAGRNGAVSVLYSTEAATATAGDDYVAVSGRLDWADGDDSDRTINITIRNDALKESDIESFTFRLSSPTGAPLLLGPTQVVNIYDNDSVASPPPTTPPTGPVSTGSGGGGGAIQLPVLLFLTSLSALVMRRRLCRHAASEL